MTASNPTKPPFPLDLLQNGIEMEFLEQFAHSVVDCSSRYNSALSVSYAPENLTGKPAVYPNYGDIPDAYMLRTYGEWWYKSEAAPSSCMYQNTDAIVSEDYITVRFEAAVVPKTVSIYETYNPGAVVRIWGKTIKNTWHLLWKGKPQKCSANAIKFTPPIKSFQNLVNEIRIELNQRHLDYYTSLDAVLLTGYRPASILQFKMQMIFTNNFIDEQRMIRDRKQVQCDISGGDEIDDDDDDDDNLFAKLPDEVSVQIFGYLDLNSLWQCALVCKRWYEITLDPILYRELNLKRYWFSVSDKTLNHLMPRCKNLRKLDLSWCGVDGQITEKTFVAFLQNCGRNLTHLAICNCDFILETSLLEICTHQELRDLRMQNCRCTSWIFLCLINLTNFTALDFTSCDIDDEILMKILKANSSLKHIIIDLCPNLRQLDQVTEVVSHYNPNLITWSSWKVYSLTSVGVCHLSRCSDLRELNLGWCLMHTDPGHCLERIAIGCKDLRRLIISGWRGVSDQLLLPIIRSCKHLVQLDVLGIRNISGEVFYDLVLSSLPKLQLLDISFCGTISQEQLVRWRNLYPHVTIQRSCDDFQT